ncbi:MAG: YbfB/YjiJ family MFS transporter [Pseudomonadota bacterium]|nr:YbfB/YjiJ family MFS transporter [Pseudomonadota bacterium]
MTPLRIALAGLVALAVAMGIGRFAFTPILPMMLHDGGVDLPRASWLASTNYVGYLVGALLCTFDPWLRRRLGIVTQADGPVLVRRGLAATALLTLAMALPWPAAWPALRFAAGVVSAYVLVQSSGWCLAQLAARGAPALGGVMFAGPGAGIVASGLLASAMVSWQWRASTAWIVFALLAAALSAAVWNVFRSANEAIPAGHVPGHAAAATAPLGAAAPAAVDATAEARELATANATNHAHGSAEVATLALAYGLSGFGYIVTATFLPVIARAAIPGSPLIDLFWPIFGSAVVVGALLSSRVSVAVDRRWLIAAAYVLQATGIGLGVAFPTEAGFAIGSLMIGLPFTTLTLFALQEVRRIRPHAAAGTIGLLTAVYALGQAIGPAMVAALLRLSSGDAHAAFQRSLVIAASALLIGAAMFVASARAWPRRARA